MLVEYALYVKLVKNLGWILRHWKEVSCVKVSISRYKKYDCYLEFASKHGSNWYFAGTDFACKELCREWLHRPVFRGLPLNWFGEETEC